MCFLDYFELHLKHIVHVDVCQGACVNHERERERACLDRAHGHGARYHILAMMFAFSRMLSDASQVPCTCASCKLQVRVECLARA
jgi:hypothetical protein